MTDKEKLTRSKIVHEITSPEAKKILYERAKILSEVVGKKDLSGVRQYLRFQLGEEEQYGIPYNYLKAIAYAQQITAVPSAPYYIEGVINWRSKILAVIDLKKIFKIESKKVSANPWVIIVESQDVTLGILADEVIGDETYIASELADPLPLSTEVSSKYVVGIYQGNIAILNMDTLLKQNIEQVSMVKGGA